MWSFLGFVVYRRFRGELREEMGVCLAEWGFWVVEVGCGVGVEIGVFVFV